MLRIKSGKMTRAAYPELRWVHTYGLFWTQLFVKSGGRSLARLATAFAGFTLISWTPILEIRPRVFRFICFFFFSVKIGGVFLGISFCYFSAEWVLFGAYFRYRIFLKFFTVLYVLENRTRHAIFQQPLGNIHITQILGERHCTDMKKKRGMGCTLPKARSRFVGVGFKVNIWWSWR